MAKSSDKKLPSVPATNAKSTSSPQRVVEYQVLDGRLDVDTAPGVFQ